MQIASKINELGGGVSFAKGAKLLKFDRGGYLGQTLQPPIPGTVSQSMSGASTVILEDLLQEMKEMKESNLQVANETSKRIDRLQVEQVTSSVTNAQKKQVKQTAIGTL